MYEVLSSMHARLGGKLPAKSGCVRRSMLKRTSFAQTALGQAPAAALFSARKPHFSTFHGVSSLFSNQSANTEEAALDLPVFENLQTGPDSADSAFP